MARPAISHLLDEAVGLGARALHRFGTREPDTISQAEVFRGRALDEVLPRPDAVPAVEVARRWTTPWLVGEDLRFTSGYRPLSPAFAERYDRDYEANHVAVGRRIRHRSGGPRPTLLYLHGWLQPETPFEEAAILTTMAVRLEMDVVQLQPPYHGRRRIRTSHFTGDGYFTADLVRSIEAMRQNLHDARSLLGWLQETDRGPVGVAGVSLGGALTLALIGLEPRFAFAVPMIAHLDMGALVEDAPVLHTMRTTLARRGFAPADLHDLMGSFGWNDLQPRLPRDRILFVAARHDRFFRPGKTVELWQRWGEPPIHWYPGGHMEIAFHLWGAVGVMQRWLAGIEL